MIIREENAIHYNHLRVALCSDLSSSAIHSAELHTFRLVPDAGLEVCLEEGLAGVFLVAALVVLLSGAFFTLDAGVLEAGFFPVTSFCRVSNIRIRSERDELPSSQCLVERMQ